jgi:hypothetical protein
MRPYCQCGDFSANVPNILSKTRSQSNSNTNSKVHSHTSPPFLVGHYTAIIVNINAETGTLYFLYKTTIDINVGRTSLFFVDKLI